MAAVALAGCATPAPVTDAVRSYNGRYEGHGTVPVGFYCGPNGSSGGYLSALIVNEGTFMFFPFHNDPRLIISGEVTEDGSLKSNYGQLGRIKNDTMRGSFNFTNSTTGCRHRYVLVRTIPPAQ